MNIPVVGILRGFPLELLPGILGAVRRGGLEFIEITMNSPGATEQIRRALELAPGMKIGAGTVTDERALDDALAAGATFIVTPVLNERLITSCVQESIPVYPGALSPTEVQRAWELGATMVKIFPAELPLLRALRGPFPEIKLMPVGGVDLNTVPDFIHAGASAFGVGSPLFEKTRVHAADWPWLEARTRAFISACAK